MFTLLAMIVSSLFTLALVAVPAWVGFQRVRRHLDGNPEALQAVTTHILMPLLRRPPKPVEEPPEKKDEPPHEGA